MCDMSWILTYACLVWLTRVQLAVLPRPLGCMTSRLIIQSVAVDNKAHLKKAITNSEIIVPNLKQRIF